MFSIYDGTSSLECHYSHIIDVSWWNSLTYGDAMTTEYLYKGETTSRMQIVIETVPVHHVKYRDCSSSSCEKQTVPVHHVKYRDCSSSPCEIQRLFFVQVIQ